jgi:UDP-2,4-diacetamido-2,4,6-trideoxy-beta-L-altropyranose hydrolase
MSMMSEKTLLVRADANAEIGIGHVMRCLALAQAWQENGGKAIFALGAGSEQLEERIRSEGAQVQRIAKPSSGEDASQTAELCATSRADWLVLDGYHFSTNYLRRMEDARSNLLLMDFGATRQPCRCDILLNSDLQAASEMCGASDGNTQLLLGPRYALLRREFLSFHLEKREVAEKARRVLITLGGGDAHNVTLQVLEALEDLDGSQLDVTVVVGHSNPHLASLHGGARKSRHQTTIQTNVETMPELMSKADLAITAGGGTCYELAYLGVPMFLITTAENHEGAVEAFGRARAAYNAGWFTSLGRSTLAERLRHVIQDHDLRKEIVDNSRSMVDGKGSGRVVKVMLAISQQRPGTS